MGLLPDHKIARELAYGELEVEPVNLEEQLQPASLDVRLGKHFKQFNPENGRIIDVDEGVESMIEEKLNENDEIVIYPGDFFLADTKESFSIPDDILGELTGRSSVARLGITVHQTAGIFDPGFSAPSGVLEITNVGNRPVKLKPGMRIAQMTFNKLDGSANNPYNSEDNKYQGQEGATESRIDNDF
jgi:dCTP deaminase